MATTYTRREPMFDGTSAQSSTYTSNWHLVADYDRLAISLNTSTTSTSLLTLTASLDDGFTAAPTNTSTVTTITVAGIYAVDPGLRWIRAERGSQESLAIVTLQLGM